MEQTISPPRGRPGRPTKAQTVARHAELLNVALDHFLEKGLEGTTIEAIAAEVQMTKRTIYARYPDKASLFLAAVLRAIEHSATPLSLMEAAVTDDFEETLTALALLRVNQVITPSGVRLQRIINTESYRFPEIFYWSYEYGAEPVTRFLAGLFDREVQAGRLALEDTQLAATMFITMVVSAPARMAMATHEFSRADIERRARMAVRLFLQGALPRPTQPFEKPNQ